MAANEGASTQVCEAVGRRPKSVLLPARVNRDLIKQCIEAMPVRVRRDGAGGEGPWRLSEIFNLSLRQAIGAWQDWAQGKKFLQEEFLGKEFPLDPFHSNSEGIVGRTSISATALSKMDDEEWEFDYERSTEARERDGVSSPVWLVVSESGI